MKRKIFKLETEQVLSDEITFRYRKYYPFLRGSNDTEAKFIREFSKIEQKKREFDRSASLNFTFDSISIVREVSIK